MELADAILDDDGCQAQGCSKWPLLFIGAAAAVCILGTVKSKPSAQKSRWFCQCVQKLLGGGSAGISERIQ
ncbi:hypothetical protein FB192DRAFT_1371427 [Mucor lusitanicus]|uniref:Uncharacterized protein n=1 Tax=Mucor circinelloides f. lusitanicus TaxID=29924 RepID=A0A8H4BMN4_MUCCL|nr:hypothetical protein FB192DRAFT_1371427 [Mucor lusitanicus]